MKIDKRKTKKNWEVGEGRIDASLANPLSSNCKKICPVLN